MLTSPLTPLLRATRRFDYAMPAAFFLRFEADGRVCHAAAPRYDYYAMPPQLLMLHAASR